ncbi:TlpA family protein disulfide reductase [Streptomyces sp. NBC_00829]|uniref:TlpA family protein disulfide reductase n=1 Tax=Streptomyces sp. NBC_00829 TaxID=2903679 RepID=UPI0038679D9D|nr:TlpA family protein disulfide reductase [Streptomyces sp. NBC_00829]
MGYFRDSRAAVPTALIAAGVFLLASCDDGGKSGGGGSTNFVAGNGGISTVPRSERQPAHELKGETLGRKQLDVADLKGKVVVMNVWGSWCPPCRAEAPSFAKVAEETKAKGVEFVGINTRDTQRSPAIAFENDYGLKYPSLYDPIGKLIINGFPKGSLNPQTIPSTIILDRDGKIAARALKALNEEDLRKLIDPLIAEK